MHIIVTESGKYRSSDGPMQRHATKFITTLMIILTLFSIQSGRNCEETTVIAYPNGSIQNITPIERVPIPRSINLIASIGSRMHTCAYQRHDAQRANKARLEPRICV